MKNITKKIWMLVMGLVVQTVSLAQPNVNCEYPLEFCSDTTLPHNYLIPRSDLCQYNPLELWFMFYTNNALTDLHLSGMHMLYGYSIWGPFSTPLSNPCTVSSAGASINYTNSSSAMIYPVSSNVGGTLPAGYYYVRVTPSSCSSSITFNTPKDDFSCTPHEDNGCENCIGSFAPEPEKKYLLGAWVKEDNAPQSTVTYSNPQISLIFYDAVNTPTTLGPFQAEGLIIDGWQRMEEEFTVPAGSVKVDVVLSCTNDDCFFDDIRVFPYDGSMKSYVYDPVTLRLVAELDERNYATMYEYDEEGKLVRIKKETERGIMTIQESKSSTVKQ